MTDQDPIVEYAMTQFAEGRWTTRMVAEYVLERTRRDERDHIPEIRRLAANEALAQAEQKLINANYPISAGIVRVMRLDFAPAEKPEPKATNPIWCEHCTWQGEPMGWWYIGDSVKIVSPRMMFCPDCGAPRPKQPEPPAKEKQMNEAEIPDDFLVQLALEKYACACNPDSSKAVHEWAMALKLELLRRLYTLAAQREACGNAGAAWVAKNTNHFQVGVEEVRQAILDARPSVKP